MEKVYNKLVRDNIPDIILKDNELPTTRILNDEEYIQELNKKLKEEVNEYLESQDIVKKIRNNMENKVITLRSAYKVKEYHFQPCKMPNGMNYPFVKPVIYDVNGNPQLLLSEAEKNADNASRHISTIMVDKCESILSPWNIFKDYIWFVENIFIKLYHNTILK